MRRTTKVFHRGTVVVESPSASLLAPGSQACCNTLLQPTGRPFRDHSDHVTSESRKAHSYGQALIPTITGSLLYSTVDCCVSHFQIRQGLFWACGSMDTAIHQSSHRILQCGKCQLSITNVEFSSTSSTASRSSAMRKHEMIIEIGNCVHKYISETRHNMDQTKIGTHRPQGRTSPRDQWRAIFFRLTRNRFGLEHRYGMPDPRDDDETHSDVVKKQISLHVLADRESLSTLLGY